MGAPVFPIDGPLALVVEDDDSNRDLFAQLLTFAGLRAWTFSRATDALAAIDTRCPDIVVTDMVLPGMGGVAFARALRAKPGCERVPIVFVTGWPMTPDLREQLPHTGVHVIMKPFLPDRLVARVHRALAGDPKRAARATTPSQRLPETTAELQLKSRRILLIEDDAPFRYVVTRQLRHAGADVLDVSSLAQARAALQGPAKVDAIVSDIVLPDGDAPDVLRGLEQERRVPVLYITSFPPDRFGRYGLTPTDPQLLEKPFDEATLVRRIRALCA